jgi:hypothetical protein
VTLGRTAHGSTWAFHNNVVVTLHQYRQSSDRDTLREYVGRISTAAVYEMNEKWHVLTDIGTTQADLKSDHAHPVFGVLGLKYSPSKKMDLDGGVRITHSHGYNERLLGVGLAWRF